MTLKLSTVLAQNLQKASNVKDFFIEVTRKQRFLRKRFRLAGVKEGDQWETRRSAVAQWWAEVLQLPQKALLSPQMRRLPGVFVIGGRRWVGMIPLCHSDFLILNVLF